MVSGKDLEDNIICEDIAEFLYELLQYANDKDIKTFLCDCVGIKLIKVISSEQENPYKKVLLQKITEYFYYNEIAERKYISNEVRILYKHLYLLSRCYYSYIFFRNKKIFINNVITNLDRQKFIKILIESYAKNKFYYYFNKNKNKLIKIIVYSKKCTTKDYKEELYILKDINGKTHIINEKRGININIGKILPWNNIFKNNDFTSIDDKFLNSWKHAFYGMNFQDIKDFHYKIVSALTENYREKCIYCNPDINSIKTEPICNNCDNLLKKLEELKKYIEEEEQNLFIRRIRKQDFKNLILKIQYNNEIGIAGLRKERKNKLNKFVKKLEKEIAKQTELNKNKLIKSYTNYKKLSIVIKDVKQLINNSFNE